MVAGVRAFLSDVLDYAGLFPPAKLPLAEAMRSYARYRLEPEAWLLSRFICPAQRLVELCAYRDLFAVQPPFPFAALGRGGNDFLPALQADLEAIQAFRQGHGPFVDVAVLEVKPPESFSSLGELIALVERLGPPRLTVVLEAAPGNWEQALEALAAANRESASWKRCQPLGIKLRTGGLEAAAFPTVSQVAAAIASSIATGVPLKCTAGLHHPIRHFNASVHTKMHGFINVFGAAILAHAGRLAEDELPAVLEDEDSRSFHFDDRGFGWKNRRADLNEIEAARRSAIISFGSCSFDEPCADLRALGWLP